MWQCGFWSERPRQTRSPPSRVSAAKTKLVSRVVSPFLRPMSATAVQRECSKLADGSPFVIKRVTEEDGTTTLVCVCDAQKSCVYREMEFSEVPQRHLALPVVELPGIPKTYTRADGEIWETTSIGGVSKTTRFTSVLRARDGHIGAVTLFAVGAPTETAVEDAFEWSDAADVVATVEDPNGGFVSEVVVLDAADLAWAAAQIARAGATPQLEDETMNADRDLGIERLDRIGAVVVGDDQADTHGPKKGTDNWRFEWLPTGWRPPITWDHMVYNASGHPARDLPRPLRQHVCRARLAGTQTWAPGDTLEYLKQHGSATSKRWVSSGLSIPQAKQLITAFYLLHVERVEGEVGHAARLILFRYMLLGGYTARWVGSYKQKGLHVGNSKELRRFHKMSSVHYERSSLPAKVLADLCRRDGKLRGRGSKGSRSKRALKEGVVRYKPVMTLERTFFDEERMAGRL